MNDDTMQGAQSRFLSSVFRSGHFSQPLVKHEERVSFCVESPCGRDTERRMARSTDRATRNGLKELIVFGLNLRSIGSCAAMTSVALTTGCMCVHIPNDKERQIDDLKRRGISWQSEADAGRFTPAVNRLAAFGWSLLPGAGQHFIAHKMSDAGMENCAISIASLRSEGTLMLAFSWIPFVYPFTLISGITTGTLVDANRANWLALLNERAANGTVANAPQPSAEKATKKEIPRIKPDGREAKAANVAVADAPQPSVKKATENGDSVNRLNELKRRYELGLCTEEEFNREKARFNQ